MKRRTIGSALAWLTSALFIATAAIHHTGFSGVSALATETGGDVAILMPMLWLFFSIELVILGAIAAMIARKPSADHGTILMLLAFVPAAAAALQLVYIGFIPPTAILIFDALVAIAAGAAMRWATSSPSL
jgi:hypothetical protein